MKRKRFYDVFCGLVGNLDPYELKGLYTRASRLGYAGCAIVYIIEDSSDVREAFEKLRAARRVLDILQEDNHKLYLRCHLKVSGQGKAKSFLARARRLCDLASIEGLTRESIAFASRDRRIDILTLVPGVSPRLFRGDILYIAEYEKLVEVPFSYMWDADPLIFSKKIMHARTSLQKIIAKKLPVLVSSGGDGSIDPRALFSFAELTLGADYSVLVKSASTLIEKRLHENRERILGIRPVEGVRVKADKA
ncbi:hypothetical protein MA03_08025 [Infirmifilum uzonense]|uniref:Uncharacterized protein n=1 Tax=Infirmifilum uzonense TaxID=1550241 RepID=A0A0F7FJT2_9CREN|nr:hypothetical protein [Infirmifilum uzonense]AKG39188.1 hypothetical protein MA03_08025 [Infirmifilum uzonense]